MAKLTKTSAFKTHDAKPETPMEKTTRIVKEMVDEAADLRQVKISRLRNARLEREANTPRDTKAKPARKPRGSSAAPCFPNKRCLRPRAVFVARIFGQIRLLRRVDGFREARW